MEEFEVATGALRKFASSTLPLFRFLHVSRDGDAWLSEYTMFGSPARQFLVFGSNGAVRSWVRFSRPIKILDIRGDRVLGVQTDDSDVEAVVIYRVPR